MPATIDAVASGEPGTLARNMNLMRTNPYAVELARLTARELDVLALIAQGRSNTAIARAFFITTRGVERHVNNIFRKLDLTSSEDISRRVMAALIFLDAAPSSPA
jgi:DNA-binding NarL/FixJ family response regulator